MIYLFDKDEKLIKIVRKSAVKTALQKYALTTERYVSDRLTVELKGLNADELEQVEYMAIQTMEDAHTFHYFYVAQKFSDELTTLIGVQSGIEELRKSPVYDKRPQNAFAKEVIDDLLAGTNWQARFVGETTAHSTNFYYTSVFDALKKVCEVWDLEMQFFVEMNGNRIGARYIDFKRRIGEAVGKRVVYGHNALQILQEVERTNIFTALIGRGKGEETGDGYGRKITFENVVWSTTQGKPVNKPAGQKYLELPLMTSQYGIKNADGTMRPKIGFVDFSEEENPEILIERTYRTLVDAARPQLTLNTSSVYLKGVKVGDTIRVVRHDKKLDYDTRIFEITFNRLNNQSSDIKLGDRIGKSNEEKAQTIADKAIEQFVNNEFSNFVQNLPDYLPSADGFNNNWYGAEDPTVQYPGKVLINDIWYKPDSEHEGHKIMLRWTGEVWEEILRTYDSEALRDRITQEIAQVNTSMQAQSEAHDRQVTDILSKTQSVEALANQAKTDAANAITEAIRLDTIERQATETKVANAKSQAIAEAIRLDTIERQATETKVANAKSQAIAEATQMVETAKGLLSGQISNVSTDLSQTKEAIKLLATSATVDALTGRISTAESTLQVQASEIASRVKTSDFDHAKQRISTAESSITQIGNRITTEISETKALIPQNIGSRNYIKNSKLLDYVITAVNTQDVRFWIVDDFWNNIRRFKKNMVRVSFDISFSPALPSDISTNIHFSASPWYHPGGITFKGNTTKPQHFDLLFDLSSATETYRTDNIFIRFGNTFPLRTNVKVEEMTLYLSELKELWTQATEDLLNDIRSVKTTITQTASGVEQLSTSLSTTNNKVTTAETKINQLISDVSSKVSQTDYNTLTGRMSSAETAITQNATEISKRLTSTQVESAITNKGYQTKSDVDNNITGRGYITNSALQPYALSTTVQNLVKETADSFNRTISETKALIPQNIGSRNYIKNSKLLDYVITAVNTQDVRFWIVDDFWNNIRRFKKNMVRVSFDISFSPALPSDISTNIHFSASPWYHPGGITFKGNTTKPQHFDLLFDLSSATETYRTDNIFIRFGNTFPLRTNVKVEEMTLYLSELKELWTQATEDLLNDIRSVKTTITQTASGVEQLSTSLSTTNNKVTTAETKINQLISDVSSKVSQTDYNTLTGRMSSAETAITQNATEISKRLTSTQVESAITNKGYQTKSDVDNNITGRGYITNSALQPYALSTTVQNLVKETADSFNRTISETKALIPSGESNLVQFGRPGETSEYPGIEITTHPFFYNSGVKLYVLKNTSATNEKIFGLNRFAVERNTEYTLYFKGFNNSALLGMDVHFLKRVRGSTANFDNAQLLVDNRKLSINKCDEVVVTFNTGNYDEGYIRFDNNKSVTEGTSADLYFGDVSVKKGKSNNGWSPSVKELATVTALHAVNDTVDSHTRTIGAVGTTGSILDNVSKVTQTANGLVTEVSGANGLKTQVSTLAGSYAIKNLTNSGTVLNQLNLNKDGSIKLDGSLVQITGTTYIQDGVISSAKIASLDAGKITTGTLDAARIAVNSIDGSKLAFDQAFFNGLTANEAYLQQLFAKNAFITQVQAVTLSASNIAGGILTATNGAMEVNLNAGQILYYTDQAALKRVLSGYPTQFIKFGTGTQSTDNAFRLIGAGSSSSIGSSIASFGANRNNGENNLDGGFTGVNIYAGGTTGTNVVDRIELASDILQIAHAASTGIANDPRGWTFENQNSVNNNYVFRPNTRPNSTYKALIGTSVTPINELYIDEAYIKGQRLGWILKDIANRVGHGGWANYIS